MLATIRHFTAAIAKSAAVLDAYSLSPRKDLLTQLLALNLEVAQKIDAGEPVTAPGVPSNYKHPEKLITDECVRAEEV